MTKAGPPEWPTGPQGPSTQRPLVLELHLIDEGVIGEGGMAWVHRVFDRRLQRHLAMKVLKTSCSAKARERFVQEAVVTAQLDHPAIVPVHCAGFDEAGRPACFTMKLIEGDTLNERLERLEEPLRGDALAALLRDFLKVCDALAFAHSRGVVHRDLKPENIMIGRFGEVYVMDWGIALVDGNRASAGGLTSLPSAHEHGDIVGTPCYMPPEQVGGALDRIDHRADIYTLGGILYEALTLKPPHDGHNVMAVLAEASTQPVRAPELVCGSDPPPAALSDIVMQALAFEPGDRFNSVEELRCALERFLSTGGWFRRRRFRRGTVFVREGERGECAYVVESGQCHIYRENDGRTVPLRVVGPGELFGELALLASETRTASIVAHTDVVVLEISREVLERELPEGAWTRHMVETLAARFVEYDRERLS